MAEVDKIRSLLETSGLLQYAVDSDMLIDFIFKRAQVLTEELTRAVTAENWATRREKLLEKLRYCTGIDNFPKSQGVKGRSTGKIEKDGYFIEKVVFESHKDMYVSAHLYVPQQRDGRTPAILHVPGHWMENSIMEDDLQRCCAGLAKLGFVVMNMEPFEQGERRVGWKNHGHLEALLTGITQIGLMVYEDMKAIDYLQSRSEVDGDRIGMTGTSGGGFNTVYAAPLDERIKAAAPICYAVTFPGILEGIKWYNWNGGNDLCNQIPNVISTLTFSQLLALNAPRPVLIVNADADLNFPLETARQVFAVAKPYYELYGSDLVRQTIVSGGHGEGREAREAVYGFFYQHLMGRGNGSPIPESEISVEEMPYAINYINATADKNRPQSFSPEKNLSTYIFDRDDIKDVLKPLRNLLIKKYGEKRQKTVLLGTLSEWQEERTVKTEKLNSLFVKTIDHSFLRPRTMSGVECPGYFVERILLDSEEGIVIAGLLFLPDNWMTPNKIWICLDDYGKKEFLNGPLFAELISHNQAIFALDLRGQGESLSVEFEVATMSFMIDRNLFSQRVFDILRAVEYVSLRASTGIQLDKQRLVCYGKGATALAALFAGALDERIAAVVSEEQIISYRRLLEGDSKFSASLYLYDIVRDFEIDDIATLIFPRPLIILNPVDRRKGKIDTSEIARAFESTMSLYKRFAKGGNLIMKDVDAPNYASLVEETLDIL